MRNIILFIYLIYIAMSNSLRLSKHDFGCQHFVYQKSIKLNPTSEACILTKNIH